VERDTLGTDKVGVELRVTGSKASCERDTGDQGIALTNYWRGGRATGGAEGGFFGEYSPEPTRESRVLRGNRLSWGKTEPAGACMQSGLPSVGEMLACGNLCGGEDGCEEC